MSTISQTREVVLKLLYASDLGNQNVLSQAIDYLEKEKIRNRKREFGLLLLNGVLNNLVSIDSILIQFLKEWSIDRLGVIERNILRMAVFELTNTNTDNAVIIKESVNLAKLYGADDASSFINGVLDSICKIRHASAEEIKDENKVI